jgi:hypothetical protein
MVKLRVPSIVVTIPRIAACIAIAGIVASNLQMNEASPSSGQIQPQPTATHQAILSTPAPAVSLPASASVSTISTAAPAAAADIPHSVQTAPVVTPSANASVSNLTPITQTTPPTSTGGSSTPGSTSGSSSPSLPPVPMTDSYTSTNWSGYMASEGDYTAISGSWNIPTATDSSSATAADAAWIGIGGVKSSDLIQVGTTDTVTSHGESSSAFYELLPGSAKTITNLTVNPGDSITASLSEVTVGVWKIAITDMTTGKNYTTTRSYQSSGSTAEWIEEDPSAAVGGQPMPLDTFTPVSFTKGSVTTINTDNTYTALTIAASDAQPITLVSVVNQTTTPIITPSVLGSDGQSFTLTENSMN